MNTQPSERQLTVKQMNEIRKERGLLIAATSRITRREKGGYIVPSQSGRGSYIVSFRRIKENGFIPAVSIIT